MTPRDWFLLVVVLYFTAVLKVEARELSDPLIRAAISASAPPATAATWQVPQHLFNTSPATPVVETNLIKFGASSPNTAPTVVFLVIATMISADNPTGIYPHDYRRCVGIHLGSLDDVTQHQVGEGIFPIMETTRTNIHEFATNLIVVDRGTRYDIDSQIFASRYPPIGFGVVYNFQIWSSTLEDTRNAIERLLNALRQSKPTRILNTVATPAPQAILQRLRFVGDRLALQISALMPMESAEIVFIAWSYPNLVPAVTQHQQSLGIGKTLLTVPLELLGTGITDVQVILRHDGVDLDETLASFNHFGHHSSNWFPFSDGSSVAMHRPMDAFAVRALPGETSINDSAVRLSGTLNQPGSFLGMFIDLLPDLEVSPDLRRFDAIILRARNTQPDTYGAFIIKLETDDPNEQYTAEFQPSPAWNNRIIPFAAFQRAGQPMDWSLVGHRIRRITLAAIFQPGQPTAVSIDISDLSMINSVPIEIFITGEGLIHSAPNGDFCNTNCTVVFGTDSPVTLRATPAVGWNFDGWILEGSTDTCSDLQSSCTLLAQEGIRVNARFTPLITGVAMDFDEDGKSDIGLYRSGTWFILRSSDNGITSVGFGGVAGDIPVPADYDGDGKTDIALYRNGTWFILRSSDNGITSVGFGGVAGDIPVPADYDGDGKADIALYRNGIWFILRSSDNGITSVGFGGVAGDIPVPADYDGDGKADIALYRNGTWFILRSSDNGITSVGFGGVAGDIPVPADYDGDGKADIALYRNGIWFILRSSDNGITSVGFGGVAGDIPVPADYDGDGKTDIALYRNGTWFILRSSDNGITSVGFGGVAGDIPLN